MRCGRGGQFGNVLFVSGDLAPVEVVFDRDPPGGHAVLVRWTQGDREDDQRGNHHGDARPQTAPPRESQLCRHEYEAISRNQTPFGVWSTSRAAAVM